MSKNSLRPSQIITTFGPGAVVNTISDSVIVLDAKYWSLGRRVHEPRLSALLHVDEFRIPKQGFRSIAVRSFPSYRVCSNCKHLSHKHRFDQRDRRHYCRLCSSSVYPARFVTTCERGHLSEFPWYSWAHQGKPDCGSREHLYFIESGRFSSLKDIRILCKNKGCGANRSMSGATQELGFSCSGVRLWNPESDTDTCGLRQNGILVGASNLYFSAVSSALSIPPWTNPVQVWLETHWETYRAILEHRSVEEATTAFLELLREDRFEIRAVMEAVEERLGIRSEDQSQYGMLEAEYRVLSNNAIHQDRDFTKVMMAAPSGFEDKVVSVASVSRLREVKALRGFSRLTPPDPAGGNTSMLPSVTLQADEKRWLPAIETRGEGIFLRFREDVVADWEQKPWVKSRVRALEAESGTSRILEHMRGPYAARYVMLHTLSHILIRELALECGYSSTSLAERIYSGPDMAGILIYTASTDSDGSLGGLVLQAEPAVLGAIISRALEGNRFCSNDPLCAENWSVQNDALSLAACHACALISETSCENGNRLLDRALVSDIVAVTSCGFFS